MTYYDEQLKALQLQMLRKRQPASKLQDLNARRLEPTGSVRELEAAKLREQADADRPEGSSLARLWYNAVGRMDEKLERERREVCAAKVNYDAAMLYLHVYDCTPPAAVAFTPRGIPPFRLWPMAFSLMDFPMGPLRRRQSLSVRYRRM